jgi:hypothetical protein
MKRKLTAREKLHRDQEIKLAEDPKGRSMVIPRPIDVDAAVRKVRKGRLTTVAAIREKLAKEHGTDTACPFCTGIFVTIAARAAEEDRAEGRKRITPWWRVVRDNGALNEKFPSAFRLQARMLKAEGHRLDTSRKAPRVVGWERALQKL